MITYLLTVVIWSTAFVLIAIGPIVAEANHAAPRPLVERIHSPYLMTVAGVFLAFLDAGMIASLRWSHRVLGTPMWDTALVACYLVLLLATIMTLKPQAARHPWRLRLHNAGLIILVGLFLIGR